MIGRWRISESVNGEFESHKCLIMFNDYLIALLVFNEAYVLLKLCRIMFCRLLLIMSVKFVSLGRVQFVPRPLVLKMMLLCFR